MTAPQTTPLTPPTLSYLPVQQLPHARRFSAACWLLAAACFPSLLFMAVRILLPFFPTTIGPPLVFSIISLHLLTATAFIEAALSLTALFLLFSAKPTHPAATPLPRRILAVTSITLVLSNTATHILYLHELYLLERYSVLPHITPPFTRPGSPAWLAISAWFLLDALLTCVLYSAALLFALQVARYLRLRWLSIASAIILGTITLDRLITFVTSLTTDFITVLNPPPASTGPVTYYPSPHTPFLDTLKKVIDATNTTDQLLFVALAITLILLALKLPRLAQPPS